MGRIIIGKRKRKEGEPYILSLHTRTVEGEELWTLNYYTDFLRTICIRVFDGEYGPVSKVITSNVEEEIQKDLERTLIEEIESSLYPEEFLFFITSNDGVLLYIAKNVRDKLREKYSNLNI
ncbi:MAG: hypothetical protein QW512_00895 [Thermofilaceae archaeon]